MNQPWIYMSSPSWSPLPPPSPSQPSGSSQCTSPEHLSNASNLGWWSVSPLIVYLFQCYSLRTSHPRLLPQSPKVCSVHLCLFFCFAYRVIVTIFLVFKLYLIIIMILISCYCFLKGLNVKKNFLTLPFPNSVWSSSSLSLIFLTYSIQSITCSLQVFARIEEYVYLKINYTQRLPWWSSC